MRALWILVALALLPACASFKPRAMADGSYRLQCSSTVQQCVNRARKWCGDEEYVEVEKTEGEVYGVEGHQSGPEGATVVFRCGRQRSEQQWKLPPRASQSEPAASAAAVSSAAEPEPAEPARVCTPGVTQRCFGPGACQGAQACREDGAGYGPCDCGPDALDAGLQDTGDTGRAAPVREGGTEP